MKVESTVTTTDIQEIEVVTGVFVKFTKTKRDERISFSGDVYKRVEAKDDAPASESSAGYVSFMDGNLSCRINTAVLSDEEAGAVFAKIAEWKQEILKS